jgi:hypothetical protein
MGWILLYNFDVTKMGSLKTKKTKHKNKTRGVKWI